MKRIISFVLVILLLLISTTIINVSAEETNDFEKMPIKIGDEIKFYNVIKSNDDYLIEVESLGSLTDFWVQAHGYSLNSPQNKVVFNRGSKQIVIDLLTNTINIGEHTRNVELTDIRTNIDSYKIYVPMAQLLPWLNSYCLVDEQGVFNILIDEVSIWDILEDFNIDDYSFDFAKECEKGGVNSNLTKASSYIKSKGIGMVLDIIPVDPFDGITAGSQLKYYEIFDEMIRDKTSSDSIIKELFSKNKKANAILGLFEKINTDNIDKDSLTYAFPSAFKDLKTYSDVLKKVEDASKYITYLNAFEKSDETILEILNSITLNSGSYEYDNSMLSAVYRVKKSYTNKFDGIVNMFCNKLLEDSVNKVITKGMSDSEILSWCLTTLKLEKTFSSSADKQVAKIPNYESIGAAGKVVFKDNLNRTDLDSIQTLRQHAILYLYSMEKCYSAMKAYYSTRDNWEYIAMSYDTKIKKCKEMRSKFEAAGLCETEINDSSQYYKDAENKVLSGNLKDEYVTGIKELFTSINFALYNNDIPSEEVDKFTYTIKEDGTGEITGYTGDSLNIVIPSEINNTSINSIGENAFYLNRELESVILPSTIIEIGQNAFFSCENLKKVEISDSVISIGGYAFSDCTSLINIDIPDSVTNIGSGAFCGCSNLESIKLSNSISNINYNLFSYCTNLKNVNISNGIKSISWCAFEKCVNLKNITIPNSVNQISDTAFNLCINLKEIKVEENNKYYYDIDGILFHEVNTYRTLVKYPSGKVETLYTVPDNIAAVGSFAFSDCINLEYVSTSNVGIIGYDAFKNCKNLKDINIPNVSNIESGAFYNCINLKDITIPKEIYSISNHALGFYEDFEGNISKIDNFKIYGYAGTEAADYATNNDFIFIAIT